MSAGADRIIAALAGLAGKVEVLCLRLIEGAVSSRLQGPGNAGSTRLRRGCAPKTLFKDHEALKVPEGQHGKG